MSTGCLQKPPRYLQKLTDSSCAQWLVIVDRQNRLPSMSIHWKEQKLTNRTRRNCRKTLTMTRALRTSIDDRSDSRELIELPEVTGVGGVSGRSGKVTVFFNWADCRCPECTISGWMWMIKNVVWITYKLCWSTLMHRVAHSAQCMWHWAAVSVIWHCSTQLCGLSPTLSCALCMICQLRQLFAEAFCFFRDVLSWALCSVDLMRVVAVCL